MRSARVLLIALAVQCLLPLRGAAAQHLEITEQVKASVRARVDNGYNVAIVVGVVDERGTRYYAYGETAVGNGHTPDERTVFEIGSITKAFTSMVLADMAERGEVTLDDPIQTLLPEGVTAPTRNDDSITLATLASHSSGLPRLPSNLSPADPTNPYADYTVRQMYDFLSAHELRRDIGAQYEYSNFGAGLLGHLLALRHGTSYEQLVLERIAEPLGMNETRVTLTPAMTERLAQGHAGTTPVSNWDIPTLAGAGALRSTARDMLILVAANAGLSETSLYDAFRATHEGRTTAGPNMKVGLGWHIRAGENGETIWHNGGTGGYRSFAGFLPSDRTGVVVLTNTRISVDDIGFHLLDPSVPLTETRTAVDVEPAILDRYVGVYELQPGVTFDVQREGNRLTVQLTGQSRFTLSAESDTKFFLTVVDAQISFEVDDQGRATALILHQGGMDQRAAKK
jgi:CubicO group peptidase (beta-lactamase class C family)